MNARPDPLKGSGARHHRLTAMTLIREWIDTPEEDRNPDLLTIALTHAVLALSAPDYKPLTRQEN
jgi:hypothetical protein